MVKTVEPLAAGSAAQTQLYEGKSRTRPASVVHVVDDDPSVRRTVQALLGTVGIEARSFASGESFLEKYQINQPGCVLLDVQMPTLSGLEVQDELAQLSYTPPVIMISGDADIPLAVKAMQRGASDFLKKPIRWQPLHKAIDAGLRLDTERRRRLAEHFQMQNRLASLTPKESAVLELVLDGLLNKQIAARFGLSTRAIEIRRASIFRKLGVATIQELVRLFYRSTHRLDASEPYLRPPHQSGGPSPAVSC